MIGKTFTTIPLDEGLTRNSFLKSIQKYYSPSTLVGNWYDERLRTQEKRYSPTIVPNITSKEKCECGKSSYSDDYANPKQIKRPDAPTYEEQNRYYKRNAHKGNESNVLIMDSKKYLNNYTTVKDIKYRLQPPKDYTFKITDRPVKKPKEDLLQSFGNETNFGLRQWLRNVRIKENLYRSDDTTYTDCYRHPRMQIRKNKRICSAM